MTNDKNSAIKKAIYQSIEDGKIYYFNCQEIGVFGIKHIKGSKNTFEECFESFDEIDLLNVTISGLLKDELLVSFVEMNADAQFAVINYDLVTEYLENNK